MTNIYSKKFHSIIIIIKKANIYKRSTLNEYQLFKYVNKMT